MMYLNAPNERFHSILRSRVYVDKTDIIDVTNSMLDTDDRFICLSRARRFGKTVNASILANYYSKGLDSRKLFENSKAVKLDSFEEHLNKYNVLSIDMQSIIQRAAGLTDEFSGKPLMKKVTDLLTDDIKEFYSDFNYKNIGCLLDAMLCVTQNGGGKFVILIDEWDAVFRNYPDNTDLQKECVDFYRQLFKSAEAVNCISLAYMTGILPIKKYNTESALNNFFEYTMVNPGVFAPFFGFTEDEIAPLCEKHNVPMQEIIRWYDGYRLDTYSICNPKSVADALKNGECASYWSSTGAFSNVAAYIKMNFNGLRSDILRMLGGERVNVNTELFQNSMTELRCKDDCLTLLIHLGYLGYDRKRKCCYIPNTELARQMQYAVMENGWEEVAKTLRQSEELLEATISGKEEKVAAMIDAAHSDYSSVYEYNDENSLACVMTVAYYAAKGYYSIIREFNSGDGRADMVFLPGYQCDKPILIIELKTDASADSALEQIKDKYYPQRLENLNKDILCAGIVYNKATKKHTCKITKW